jgi:hypothetical protein
MALAWVRFMRRLYRSCLRFGRDFSATACGTVRRGRAELARSKDRRAYAHQGGALGDRDFAVSGGGTLAADR